MHVTVGTFNLNNLFGRWNLYVDVPTTAATSDATAASGAPRDWLEPPSGVLAPSATAAASVPDVKIVIEGELTSTGAIRWRTNPYDGKVVYKKSDAATKTLADRIKALDVDVLAIQEVESVEALEEFVREQALDHYRHLVLVEGNDDRLIDIGIISKLPIGSVTSWRHRTYMNRRGAPVFSRDLLQLDVLSDDRRRVLFTLYNNHLKSRLARDENERRAGDRRRRRQAETIAAIIAERPPPGPYMVVGDMNDSPESTRLRAIRELGLTNALADPDEEGGPYPASDPDQPKSKSWTHRYRAGGKTSYELYDQIWLNPDLAAKQTGAWVYRRKSRGGDASDHDPAWVAVNRTRSTPTDRFLVVT
jgi:endonuclease/exonuclease/phosphatase family metal-dependent hydrolase